MTRKDLKKHWHILKALKKGWVEPSDVEYYADYGWRGKNSFFSLFCAMNNKFKLRLTKAGKEKINKAKKIDYGK